MKREEIIALVEVFEFVGRQLYYRSEVSEILK